MRPCACLRGWALGRLLLALLLRARLLLALQACDTHAPRQNCAKKSSWTWRAASLRMFRRTNWSPASPAQKRPLQPWLRALDCPVPLLQRVRCHASITLHLAYFVWGRIACVARDGWGSTREAGVSQVGLRCSPPPVALLPCCSTPTSPGVLLVSTPWSLRAVRMVAAHARQLCAQRERGH
jgi:hypothetical protein